MILDFSLQFNLFAFECLRLKLIFFEQVRRRRKNNRCESLPGRTKIQEIGITFGGMAYAKNSAADARLVSRQPANFVYLASLHQRNIGLDLGRWHGLEGHTKAWRLNEKTELRIFPRIRGGWGKGWIPPLIEQMRDQTR